MKKRPIIFSGPMVKAILDDRKTQTRRLFKFRETNQPPSAPDRFNPEHVTQPCPYGQPGDRLWVRETWQMCPKCALFDYRADVNRPNHCRHCDATLGRWCPSIYMPRWASRITLEITSARVERLQDISPDDCRAEGQPVEDNDIGVRYGFGQLWQSIHGPDSWDTSPWVWVIEFWRVK